MEVEYVRDPGTEGAEAGHPVPRRCSDVGIDVPGEHGEGEKLQGTAEHLAGGECDRALGAVGQAPGIGKSDAVAADSAEAGADAEGSPEPSPFHTPTTTRTPVKPRASPAIRAGLGRSSRKTVRTMSNARDRGQSVDDPGQDGRDVSLPVGDECEGRLVEQHGEHEQLPPSRLLARQACSRQTADEKEGQGANRQPAEGNVHR